MEQSGVLAFDLRKRHGMPQHAQRSQARARPLSHLKGTPIQGAQDIDFFDLGTRREHQQTLCDVDQLSNITGVRVAEKGALSPRGKFRGGLPRERKSSEP